MACINPNSPEFIAALERIGNPLLAEIDVDRSSSETLSRLKEAGKQMGIDFQDLATYAKETGLNVEGINGVADLTKGVVAVALGKESQALTEEIVHIATAIIEQVNPQLVTKMISEIGKYKIYKETFEAYKDLKEYQLSDGKPNIRKIKKEAVDKLIVEYIINKTEGNTEVPSAKEKEERNFALKLWNAVLDFIKSLYGKTKIDIFETAAAQIVAGEVGGTVADITEGGIFFQLENPQVNDFYNKIVDIDSRMVLNPKTATDKRHYTFDGNRVTLSVTEKVKQKDSERTEFEQSQDTQKQEWGLEAHGFIENTFLNDLLDKDGYAKEVFSETALDTDLNSTIQKGVRSYLEELVRSYGPGTRFLIEKKVVNDKVKGMIASTMDLIVIEPITKEDGTKDFRVDIYDWKFTSFDKSSNEDIPFYKQTEWKAQMGEYSKILYAYGLDPKQLRRARMIPFVANYDNKIKGDKDSDLVLTSLEIGKFDNVKETKTYLLPVALDTESTGSKKVDKFIESLRVQWQKLYKKPVSPEDKFKKNIQLNQMSKAIRELHMKLDFAPMYNVGQSFLISAKAALDTYEGIDYTTLSQDDIANRLRDLLEFKASAEKFTKINDVYLSSIDKDNVTDEQRTTYNQLSKLSDATERMLLKINELQKDFVVQYALKQGITTEKTKTSVVKAERELEFIAKTFLEGTKLSPKIIRLASNAILNARSLVDINAAELINEFTPLLLDLEKEAASKGKSAFDMIGKVDGDTLSLVKKINKKFYEDLSKAKSQKDKQFLLDNVDLETYNKLAKEAVDRGIEEINKTIFSTDGDRNEDIRQYRIKKLRDSIEITRKSFNGYQGYQFAYIYGKSIKEEEHLSDDYKELRKNPAAFKMWEFMVKLNERGRDMGYLARKGMSFFPLVEATMLDKLSQTGDVSGQMKDFFKDFYTIKTTEEQRYSKVDPETGKLKKEIPKFFTLTNKDVTQLSRDLTKIGPLWIKSLLQYESAKGMEDLLFTLHSVEKAKGHIVIENGEIVYEGGEPKIDENSNKNADTLETIVNDYLYGLSENLTSVGNIGLGKISEKLGKTEEGREKAELSTKKVLQNANVLTQSLAVGLKALVAIPNYFGVNFQAFINAGNYYRFGEYEKNNLEVTTGIGLSTIDKALMDTIVPLNEDVAKEKQREIALKQGYGKWLSTWTFQDVMMVTNSAPERKLQFANAKSFNDNSMVVDGKIVNIRQYLRKQDSLTKYEMSFSDRRALEKTFEDRVKELKETKSLPKIAKIEDDKLVIPGVSKEELAKYRTKVIEFSRNLNGQMSNDNKADYRRDSILKSFMMFKSWIPKQVSLRTLDIQKNVELDEWEYGRTRVFIKTWAHLGFTNITKIRDIIQGNEEGIKIMDEILEEKRKDYFKKTGKDLEITEEEFYDMMRRELTNQMKELGLLFSLLGVVLAARAAVPPDDADTLTKNKYKFWMKAVNKISDEIAFYYDPRSFESITKGSILPALGLLIRAEQATSALLNEGYGYATDDEKLQEKAHPIKYFLNMIPGPAQFQNEILPIIDPELAKELGIRITAEARAMR